MRPDSERDIRNKLIHYATINVLKTTFTTTKSINQLDWHFPLAFHCIKTRTRLLYFAPSRWKKIVRSCFSSCVVYRPLDENSGPTLHEQIKLKQLQMRPTAGSFHRCSFFTSFPLCLGQFYPLQSNPSKQNNQTRCLISFCSKYREKNYPTNVVSLFKTLFKTLLFHSFFIILFKGFS